MNTLFLDAKRSAAMLRDMEGMGEGGWAGSVYAKAAA
jgi:hypothetical protein